MPTSNSITQKRINQKHGETRGGRLSAEYAAYALAKTRCTCSTYRDFHRYGGRGIQFRFTSFHQFLTEIGRKPTPKHSLDRIDVNGHYEIGNVRWATKKTQDRNKRTSRPLTAFGRTQSPIEWQEEYHQPRGVILNRINHGWCNECAISIVIHQGICPHKS